MKGFIKKTSYSLFLFFILLLSHHFSQDSVIRLQSVIDPALNWHTYLGKNLNDSGEAIAIDEMGNVYIAGWSNTNWGSPVNSYAGGQDVFAAKLDKNGVLLWHTFLGSSRWDESRGIAVDANGNVYVVGTSKKTWGTPVHSHTGDTQDAFAAKLNSKGVLKWHTFMGGSNSGDRGMAITVDTFGNVYVGGFGGAFWDTDPVYPISSGTDGWLAKLDSRGKRQWYTPMGSSKLASIRAIALDTIGNIYVSGYSEGPFFKQPVNSHSGDWDTFVAKLDSSGEQQWHTFMGSASEDDGMGIAIDGSGNIYVSGSSGATWGNPINSYAGKGDAFVAKLNPSGKRLWNTFLGSEGGGLGWSVAADQMGNAYAVAVNTGDKDPPFDHAGLFTAKLNHNGAFLWNTFLVAISGEGNSIALDKSGNIYLGGRSDVHWRDPVNPYVKRWDAFAAKIDRGIRVVSWNLLNYSGLSDDSRDEEIRKVIDTIEPDILVIQEMEGTLGVDHFLKKVLNANSRRKYKAAQFYDGPDTDNALFYDKSRLNLKSSQQIPTSFRDISEYSLKIKKGPSEGSEFKLYSVHFTEGRGSSHKKQRENQAETLRTHLNGLPMDSVFLVCGTFNMTTSQEKAYKILTGSQADSIGGNIGRLKDLIKKSGKWYNRTKFKHTHTESTRKAKFGGGAGGGLDDRYDMILVSYGLDQNSGLTFMPGSYVVCGNDGKRLNKSINDPENKMISSDIADALYKASDHLPVIIDLVKMK
jgi:endonuclease/exonuclease/phosphatase family metal-dependent hydrolase